MNVKSLLKVFFYLSLLLFWGCSENYLESDNSSATNVNIHAVQSGFKNVIHTKTIVGEEKPDGALVMNWNVNDEIGVFTSKEQNKRFSNSSPESAPDAIFSLVKGQTLQGVPEVAYYPYVETNTNRNNIPVTIPNEQNYLDASSVAQYDIKAANITVQDDGSFIMNMVQMNTLLRFEIDLQELKNEIKTRTLETELKQLDFQKQHIQRVRISTDDNARLTGNYTYDLDKLNTGLVHSSSDKSDGALLVNILGESSLDSKNVLVLYAMVAPGQHKGNKLSCIVETEDISFLFTSEILCDFKTGCYYMIPIDSKSIGRADQNSIKVVIKQELPKPIYPSADEETANCYMINTLGAHEFWGTQIGNGAKGIIKGAGFHTEDPYINPLSAKLVWQDVQNFVSDVTFNPADGKVHYKANKTSGNAVIAVYDGPNGTGNVLWSWHIWGVGDSMPVAEEYMNMAKAKFMVMDRPLGAHSKTSTTATLYQWGRKDPIPNSSVYYRTEDVNSPAINIEESYPVNKNSNTHTLLETIQEPDKIMYSLNPQDNMARGSYLYPVNKLLWGDGNELSGFDFKPDYLADPRADNKWLYKKTIYDPSPVGYRVANKFTFTAFLNVSDGTTAGKDGLSGFPGLPQYVNYVEPLPNGTREQSAWIFKRTPEDNVGAYWAMTGRRSSSGTLLEYANNGKGPNSVGLICWVWTSGLGSAEDDGSIFRSDGAKLNKTDNNEIDWGQITVVDWAAQINIHAVRCVVDDPTLIVYPTK